MNRDEAREHIRFLEALGQKSNEALCEMAKAIVYELDARRTEALPLEDQ